MEAGEKARLEIESSEGLAISKSLLGLVLAAAGVEPKPELAPVVLPNPD